MTLEMRLARLEAAEQIRNLKARYCELCDRGYLVDKLAELFVEDGVWDGGEGMGRHEGIAAIRRFFEGVRGRLSFAIHHVSNPRISVSPDAKSATGRWYLLQAMTTVQEGRAMWMAATYEDDYVLIGDAWRFKTVVLKRRFSAPYERGWAGMTSVAP